MSRKIIISPPRFVADFWPFAYRSMLRAGVPFEFALAQAALESGWGRHAPGANFFGIKTGRGYRGKKQLLWTREHVRSVEALNAFPESDWSRRIMVKPGVYEVPVRDYFRAYDDPADCFADHARVLKLPRYATAWKWAYGKFNTGEGAYSPFHFASAIAAGGYATDVDYADKLISTINRIILYINAISDFPDRAAELRSAGR